MDLLESLSDEDLKAYAAGDLNSVSDSGLQLIAASKQRANQGAATTPATPQASVDSGPNSSPPVSKTESLLRGAAQGASLGTADEATGAGEALWDKLTKNQRESFLDLYRQHRDESRANYAAARKANPKTYMAGEIAGTAADALIPGVGEAMLASPVLTGAAIGLGNSNADLTDPTAGHLVQAGIDTAVGATIGGVTGKIGQAIGGATAEDLAQKAGKYATDAAGVTGDAATPELGQALLKTGSVAAGDTQSQIAAKMAQNVNPKILSKQMAPAGNSMGADILAKKYATQIAGAVDDAAGVASQPNPLSLLNKLGPKGMIANQVASRAQSTMAVSTDFLAKTLARAPKVFGQYAAPLQAAAARGAQALAATDYVLQQSQPNYKARRDAIVNQEDGVSNEANNESN